MNTGVWGKQLDPKEAAWVENRLASFRLFSDIPKEEIPYIVEQSFFLGAGPDRVVMFKGTMYGEVFILLDGKATEEGARVQIGDSMHDFSWIQRTLGPGDTFGELPGRLQHPQPYTVVIEDRGIAKHNVMILPAEVLGDIIERHAGFATRLYREDVAARLRTIPALQDIPNLDLRYLALVVQEERLAKGAELPERYPETQCLWIVNQGRVAAFEFPRRKSNAPGPDHYLSAGQVFVLSESPVGEPLHLYKAVMETDASLFRIPFDQLKNLHDKTLYGKDLSTSLEYVDPASELAEMSRRNGRCILGLGFDKRSPRFLRVLSGYIGWEYVPQWEEVVVQGERANKLYILRKGEALVKATDKSGRERPRSYLPDPVFRSCHFGLDSMLYTGEQPITVEATKPTEWFSFAHEDFVQLGKDLEGDLKKEYDEWKSLLIAGEDAKDAAQEREQEKKISEAFTQALKWLRKQLIPDQDYCYDKIKLSPGEMPEFCRWKHWWIYVRRVSLFILVITIGIGLTVAFTAKENGSSPQSGILWLPPWALLAGLTLSAVVAFLVSRDFLNDFLVVTNQRVIARDQVLLFGLIPAREASQEMPIQHVQDVKTFAVGIVRRLLDVGNIYIQSAATAGTIRFYNIGHPNSVRERILRISMRTQRIRIARYKESLKRDIKRRVLNLLSPTTPKTAIPHRPLVTRPERRGRVARFLLSIKESIGKAQRSIESLVRHAVKGRPEPYAGRPNTREVKWKHIFFTLSWQEGDRIIWRKHWIKLYEAILLPVFLFLLLAAAAVYFLFFSPPAGSKTRVAELFALLFLADAFFFFLKYQNWSNDQYIVDKTMLHDVDKGLLSVRVSDVITPLSRIQNVDVRIDNWKAKVLGYGTIKVSTAAAGGEATFDYIPHPYQVRDLIMRRIWELAEAQEQKRAEEDRKRLTTTIGLYEELKEKSRPTPPRIWHKPYKPEEPEE